MKVGLLCVAPEFEGVECFLNGDIGEIFFKLWKSSVAWVVFIHVRDEKLIEHGHEGFVNLSSADDEYLIGDEVELSQIFGGVNDLGPFC